MKTTLAAIIILLLINILKSQEISVFKVKDCTLKYSNYADTSGKLFSINNINKILLMDTVSMFVSPKRSKNIAVDLKNARQLIINYPGTVGKFTGYGALIGFGVLGSIGFIAGLSEQNNSFYNVSPFLTGLISGAFGAGVGALIGLFIGGVGSEPDILDIPETLTKVEKSNRMIKFLKTIK